MVVRNLEKELGAALFKRVTRGIELTAAGERVYGYAQGALQNAALIKAVGREVCTPGLRIAANNSSNMAVLLTSFFQSFLAGGEPLSLRFTECGVEQMLASLAVNEYDLGFLFVPDMKRSAFNYLVSRRQLIFTPLLDTDLALYVGKNHPLASRTSVTAEELTKLSFIQLEGDFFTVEDLLAGAPAFRKKALTIRRVVLTNSDHLMIRMLNETELCNLGSYWLRNIGRQYDFKRIPVEGMERRIAFGCLSRKDEPPSSPAKQFIAFLRQALEQDAAS